MTPQDNPQDVGASADADRAATPSGLSPAVSGIAGIPSASELFMQLHYPEAVEALARGIGPLILEEFDCEPYGAKWDAISEKDRIVIRFIASRGLSQLITHCHITAGKKRAASVGDAQPEPSS